MNIGINEIDFSESPFLVKACLPCRNAYQQSIETDDYLLIY